MLLCYLWSFVFASHISSSPNFHVLPLHCRFTNKCTMQTFFAYLASNITVARVFKCNISIQWQLKVIPECLSHSHSYPKFIEANIYKSIFRIMLWRGGWGGLQPLFSYFEVPPDQIHCGNIEPHWPTGHAWSWFCSLLTCFSFSCGECVCVQGGRVSDFIAILQFSLYELHGMGREVRALIPRQF